MATYIAIVIVGRTITIKRARNKTSKIFLLSNEDNRFVHMNDLTLFLSIPEHIYQNICISTYLSYISAHFYSPIHLEILKAGTCMMIMDLYIWGIWDTMINLELYFSGFNLTPYKYFWKYYFI